MIRKVLAWFIKPGEEPTKENILKYALKNYLNDAKVHGFRGNGLCHYLSDSLMHYLDVRAIYCSEIKHYIPLYDINYAIKHFNAKDGLFWWSIKDWWHRYRFMKWLIKQYKEKTTTQEEKELLFKDICARLPYKPFAQWHHKASNKFRDVKIMKVSTYGKNIDDYDINVLCQPEPGVDYEASIVDIKPYLRPMPPSMAGASVDWLNKNMFDHRGLIAIGLAIAITEENNPYKKYKL